MLDAQALVGLARAFVPERDVNQWTRVIRVDRAPMSVDQRRIWHSHCMVTLARAARSISAPSGILYSLASGESRRRRQDLQDGRQSNIDIHFGSYPYNNAGLLHPACLLKLSHDDFRMISLLLCNTLAISTPDTWSTCRSKQFRYSPLVASCGAQSMARTSNRNTTALD